MSVTASDNYMKSLGLDAYRVGGSVRDDIMGKTPKDADYMVRGVSLSELKAALGDASRLKLRDGQHVGYRKGNIEIVLPRTEVSTGPGHGDFKIVVDPMLSLAEDAKRRDFTFNAIYKRLADDKIIDPIGTGIYDLQHRMVQVTHVDTFRDDPLRMLRALRFVSQGFSLAAETRTILEASAPSITGLTANGHMSGTVYTEMSRILMGRGVRTALALARDTGVLGTLFPELKPMLGFDQGSRYHDMTTDEHTFMALHTAANMDAPLHVRWALLFHDSGKPEVAWVGKDGRKHYYKNPEWTASSSNQDHELIGARLWSQAANRMNVDNDTKTRVRDLIQNHMLSPKKTIGVQARRLRVKLGDDGLADLILHRACDVSAKGGKKVNHDHLRALAELEQERASAQAAGVPASLKQLAINGHDLIELGIDGRDIGKTLNAVLDEVVVRGDELALSREWQLKRAEALAQRKAESTELESEGCEPRLA